MEKSSQHCGSTQFWLKLPKSHLRTRTDKKAEGTWEVTALRSPKVRSSQHTSPPAHAQDSLKQRALSYSNIKHGCRQQEALQIIKQWPVSGICFVLFSHEKTHRVRLRVLQSAGTQLSTGFDRKHPQQRLPKVLNTWNRALGYKRMEERTGHWLVNEEGKAQIKENSLQENEWLWNLAREWFSTTLEVLAEMRLPHEAQTGKKGFC